MRIRLLYSKYVAYWHITSFRCAASSERYRGKADIEEAVPIKLQPRSSLAGARRPQHATGRPLGVVASARSRRWRIRQRCCRWRLDSVLGVRWSMPYPAMGGGSRGERLADHLGSGLSARF